MRDEQDYKSLAKFIKIVIDLDNKLSKRIMKKRYNQSKDRAEFIYKSAINHVKQKKNFIYSKLNVY